MPYVDLNTIHNPATGTIAPATWGDTIRANDEFFIDPPACNAFHNTTQSVTNGGAGTIVACNSESFDNDAMHSTVTNNSRITINTAGRYLFTASLEFATNSTGIRQAAFHLNGTVIGGSANRNAAFTGITTFAKTFVTRIVAAADFMEVNAFQDSGAGLNVTVHEFTALFLTR